ncbi:transglycosylase family protein, partial [Candidatus Saccharibacteria bacterium]|nr:transglycosylase family protein [Candidatus Saccharibacteria bacterium]
AVPVRTASGNVWDQIAQCESGGNWSINTGNGYTGGLQFAPGTWGGYKGYASAAAAPKSIQIERAEQVRAAHGGSYGSWPACSARLGLN